MDASRRLYPESRASFPLETRGLFSVCPKMVSPEALQIPDAVELPQYGARPMLGRYHACARSRPTSPGGSGKAVGPRLGSPTFAGFWAKIGSQRSIIAPRGYYIKS
jgi:hypothetical protein